MDDTIREVEWRDLADTVLVFVCLATLYGPYLLTWFQDGLFAAFLSAFLVFLIPQLQPNSGDLATDVLIHISQQLSNSTTPAFQPTTFQVSPNAAAVNMLFFLSLALVVTDAFLAMLVKGWLQEFDRGWRKYTVAHLRAQERERRLQELVALLPILIQGSLLLFWIGLLVLLFPLHQPSAILCSVAFVGGVAFYGCITYISIVNHYAPFSSSVSRLLVRGLAILQTRRLPIIRITRRIASAIPFRNRSPPPLNGQQVEADISRETAPPFPWNAEPAEPYNPDGVEKSKVVPRSRSDIDPQTYIHVLERLVTTTTEAVESIPIFLELLDQPVKDRTLRPLNMEKWRELFHITLGLLRDQSTFPVSAAWTLARTMMICYNHETVDRQLCLALQHHLGSSEIVTSISRMPLHHLFSHYWSFWLSHSHSDADMWRTIALLEPSDAADAELLWMVNTFHRHMQSNRWFLEFFVAVLTYVSSTEQSRRSQVPLTAAVVYAMHTIIFAHNRGDINFIDRLYILPGTISISESVSMTSHVEVIDALELWSEECIQLVKDLLQWRPSKYPHHDLRLPLIAALYIDSTRQAHARSAFADLVKYTSITDAYWRYSNAYDQGKLAVYGYMAVSQEPLNQDRYPHAAPYDVIKNIITEGSTLQLSRLRILDIAVKHVHKTASDWLYNSRSELVLHAPGDRPAYLGRVDHWVLVHLDTLFALHGYSLPVKVKELTCDTPEKVYIAKARLDFYDSLEKAEYEGANGAEPDPELLRVLLWSKDYGVCTRAFRWCLDLVPVSQPGKTGDADSTRLFIPETMGYEWIEHFIRVLCNPDIMEQSRSSSFRISYLHQKWTMLPSSWCCEFASASLFTTVHPDGMHEVPAYHAYAVHCRFLAPSERQASVHFLATMLDLIKSSLTWGRLTSVEDWLPNLPVALEHQDAHTQIEHILAIRKQQLVEEALWFFEELPMAGLYMGE